MKKTIFKMSALLLSLCMLLVSAACGEQATESIGGTVITEEIIDDGTSDVTDSTTESTASDKNTSSGKNNSSSKNNSSKADKTSSTKYNVKIDTQNVAGDTKAQLALQAKLKDSAKGKTITLLSTWGDDGIYNQCYMQMYKAMCGGTLKIIRCADWSGMQQKLASMHVAGNSPDLYEVTNQDYPSIMYADLLAPLSDDIDFSSELYSDRERKLLSQLSWNGKVYFWPTMYSTTSGGNGVWFNRSVLENAGLNDSEMPDALVKANKWDWDAFYDIQKRTSDSKKGITGAGGHSSYSLSYVIVNSTGEDFVKITKNGIESNFTSANVTRAMNMFKKIANASYYLTSEEADQVFMRGKLAMYMGSPSFISNTKVKAMANDGIAEFVPFPRDPKQSTYKVFGSVEGYAVTSGSKNKTEAINFIKMLKASDYYGKQVYDIQTKNYDAKTKKALKNYSEVYDKTVCYSLGIKDILGLTWTAAGNDFISGSDTWENRAQQYSPQVQSALNQLGKK